MADPGLSLTELAKAAKELADDSDGKSRATPLQVIGRSYLLILVVLSVGAAAAGYLDYLIGFKTTQAEVWHFYTCMTILLRFSVPVVAWIGIGGLWAVFPLSAEGDESEGMASTQLPPGGPPSRHGWKDV